MSFDEDSETEEELRPLESPAPAPRYEGEDRSPTSRRELLGWYSYAVAAEVFAVVGVGAFLPLTLEQLARERGVLWSDKSTSCSSTSPSPTVSGTPGSSQSLRFTGRDAPSGKGDQCVVNFLGAEITTASFAMYTSSAAVLVQAVTLICFSSFADHGPYRKRLLLTFAYTGAVACCLFLFISPAVYFLGSVLVIVAVTCLGSSFTLLNAFLPLLVANSSQPDAEYRDVTLEPLNPDADSDHVSHHVTSEKLQRDLQLSGNISSKGVGIGYAAAVFVELLSIGLLAILSKTTSLSRTHPTLPLRFVLLLTGTWWGLFSLPTSLFLRPRPGPPLPHKLLRARGSRIRSLSAYLIFSLSSFWRTLKQAFKLKQVILFLCSWFLLSDAIATLSGTAVLFAKTELKMGTIPIALLSITSVSSGILGAWAWPLLSARFNIPQKHVILYCIGLMFFIPLYGLLGFLPFVRKWGFFGLQQPWEIYPIGVLHGFVMGGLSSYCRAFYAHLIPPGAEAAFFALYAVTDKGSSAVGPAVVGRIVDVSGSIRAAFVFLAVVVAVTAPLVACVDVRKGREDALEMAKLGMWDRGHDGEEMRVRDRSFG